MSNLKPSLVDVDDEEYKSLCDKYDVDELPHTQILSDDGKVLLNMIGVRTPEFIIEEIKKLKEQK